MFSELHCAIELLTQPLNRKQVELEIWYHKDMVQDKTLGYMKLPLLCDLNM